MSFMNNHLKIPISKYLPTIINNKNIHMGFYTGFHMGIHIESHLGISYENSNLDYIFLYYCILVYILWNLDIRFKF